MSELNNLLSDIEVLRENLIKLIEKKEGNLQDPDIIATSQILNAAITKYNEFILKKSKSSD
ncbi:Spo0E like sporulation regulatory protein [Proteiniborus ethanoligenes]|uniref:Spo0E like sporulation regulatory protein n=1 Tax=Proteiniborus ethanoligenes TaxID=415015 RepID=A0A1H3RT91_9FIRM|nr:aspartyl-phosphate phosphatase Spo0E family protein [Proteiniborus ethanoligenes]SDZ28896.1 Spo0E like sporulation regulatory protein [Proteiniborus ethanoligenes]